MELHHSFICESEGVRGGPAGRTAPHTQPGHNNGVHVAAGVAQQQRAGATAAPADMSFPTAWMRQVAQHNALTGGPRDKPASYPIDVEEVDEGEDEGEVTVEVEVEVTLRLIVAGRQDKETTQEDEAAEADTSDVVSTAAAAAATAGVEPVGEDDGAACPSPSGPSWPLGFHIDRVEGILFAVKEWAAGRRVTRDQVPEEFFQLLANAAHLSGEELQVLRHTFPEELAAALQRMGSGKQSGLVGLMTLAWEVRAWVEAQRCKGAAAAGGRK
ncbi:hypothetical protein PLESTB_001342600 [Pleodorina starrii]|uniref:Uncharacterized protein n=1 Tax=Pleodorina starrii TaxID=330485 RepID=A0A9W6F794_9CHLO|nr:hypothetical protein PLESTM_001456500 [Pleodorina starrii]GLC58291.1 hypothetical protein PLESTB_001342600 [Pleodorina starrii]GLC66357.1 hypothetical protein PLESTF_000415700 [Pleodorina starrii]